MGGIIFLPSFHNETKKCFCLNENILWLLRKDGQEEIILYFSYLFWDKYPKPIGMEKMGEIVQKIKVQAEYIAVVAEWKYLDKYARINTTEVSIPNDYNQCMNEYGCVAMPITESIDELVVGNDGWAVLSYPGLFIEDKSDNPRYLISEHEEKMLITLEMMEAREKILRYHHKNLGDIKISIQ